MNEMMGANDIAFPHLGIYLKDVPTSFTVFGFSIAYYGLIIGLGILAGVLIAAKMAKVTGQDPDLYWDFSIYAIIFSIIGARLYYVAFSWDSYKDNLLSILNTRGGGMAIYGAVIGAFITLAVYARIKKANTFQMADTGVMGLIIGQVIGRFGNFMNREVFGEYTDSIFAMRIPIERTRPQDISESIAAHMTDGINYIQVHPTFLYESLWNVMIFVIMLVYHKHKKFQGEICLLYLGGYGLGRMWIEGVRTDQLMIGGTNIAVSQALSVVLVLFAVITDVVVRIYLKKKEK